MSVTLGQHGIKTGCAVVPSMDKVENFLVSICAGAPGSASESLGEDNACRSVRIRQAMITHQLRFKQREFSTLSQTATIPHDPHPRARKKPNVNHASSSTDDNTEQEEGGPSTLFRSSRQHKQQKLICDDTDNTRREITSLLPGCKYKWKWKLFVAPPKMLFSITSKRHL